MIVNSNLKRKINSNEKLSSQLMDMAKKTAMEELGWDILCSTSEYNENKKIKIIDGMQCFEDECFVSYHTIYHGKEFLMITYENIITMGNEQKTTNMIYLPPLGNRYFDLDLLAPYAVEADQMITYVIHELWKAIVEQRKLHPEGKISMQVERRVYES